MKRIFAREWKAIPFADDDNARALREWLASNSTQQKAEFLGCHRRDGKIRSGNFIGAVWIGEGDCRAPLVVSPKFDNLDYLQMYLDCAKDKKIGARLGECFWIWPEQASIEADDAVFSELIVCAFLRELNDLCRRRLRRYFTAEEANLFGKVKGKIMLARQLRDNIPRARAANVWCRYNTASPDFLENRVLRAALEKSAKLLARSPMRESFVLPRRWIAAARVSLAGVSVEKIFVRDFACLRKSGVFAPYRRPLQLARMVLQTLGGDPRAEFETPKRVAPFALDSAELFECYAELRLREKYPDLQAGGKKRNTRGDDAGFAVSIRPDFWLPKTDDSSARIIDAKYKRISLETALVDGEESNAGASKEIARGDVYQMVAYSRHRNFVEDRLKCDRADEIELELVYPETEESETREKSDNSFFPSFRARKILCPRKKTDG